MPSPSSSPNSSPRDLATRVGVLLFGGTMVGAAAVAAQAARGAAMGRWALALAVAAATAHLFVSLRARRLGPTDLSVVVIAAAAAHGVLLAAPPVFSDDIYRYLLDGSLGSQGLNPFAYAPESPKIADLVGGLAQRVNHGHLRTIYPPFAQAFFTVNGWLGATVVGWKLIAFAALLASGALLQRAERHGADRAGRDARPVGALLVSHPLCVFAVSGNGHVDILGVALLCGALLLWQSRRWASASALLGLAASVKLFPVGLAGAIAGRRGILRAVAAVTIAVVVLGATYVPLMGIGTKAFGSLGTYADSWQYNAGPQAVAQVAAEGVLAASGVDEVVRVGFLSRINERLDRTTVYQGVATHDAWRSRDQLARGITRLLALLVLIAVGLALWRRRIAPAPAVIALLLALFLGAPVVHPWYLLWLLPAALLSRSPTALTWCATIVLAFYAPAAELDGIAWSDPLWVRLCEYVPLAVVALVVWRRPAALSADDAPGAERAANHTRRSDG